MFKTSKILKNQKSEFENADSLLSEKDLKNDISGAKRSSSSLPSVSSFQKVLYSHERKTGGENSSHQVSNMYIKSSSTPTNLQSIGVEEELNENMIVKGKTSKILTDNCKLLKMTHKLRETHHQLTCRMADLDSGNNILEETLRKSEKEHHHLRSKLLYPTIYSNFEVAKIFENWVKVLQEELEEHKKQHFEIIKRQDESHKNIQKLTKQRRRLEESLLFYKKIFDYEPSIPRNVEIPEIYSHLRDMEIPPELESIDSKWINREICELIMEENVILRKQNQVADVEKQQRMYDRNHLNQKLQQQCQINEDLMFQYNALIEKYNTCYENFQHLYGKLGTAE